MMARINAIDRDLALEWMQRDVAGLVRECEGMVEVIEAGRMGWWGVVVAGAVV